MRYVLSPASVLAASMLAAFALAGSADAQGGRYQLEKAEDGSFVRMDTETGEMSICEERAGQLVCKGSADERAAFQDDLDRLQDLVNRLQGRVEKLENSLAARLENSLPSEEEFERTLTYMERFFRSFVGIVNELDREDAGNDPDGPNADKT